MLTFNRTVYKVEAVNELKMRYIRHTKKPNVQCDNWMAEGHPRSHYSENVYHEKYTPAPSMHKRDVWDHTHTKRGRHSHIGDNGRTSVGVE